MSPLMKRRIESIRDELTKTESGGRRNIAGERALERLGRRGCESLIRRFEDGDDVAAEVRAACQE